MKIKYFKYIYIVLIVLILSIVGSYAFFGWSNANGNNTNVSFDVISETVYINYDAGSNIEGVELYPVDDKSEGISKTITVKTDKVTSKRVSFNLYLDLTSVDSALLDSSFKWAVYSNNSIVSSGNFASGSVSCNKNSSINHIVLLSNQEVTTTEKVYILYIWIDNSVINSDSLMSKSFSFNLHADGVNALLNGGANTLYKKYVNSSKSNVTTAGGESITQVSSLGMMQDSFGNIRYYGSNPNNYVTFNGESAGWRIIGIFDTEDENGNVEKRIKLIRASSIGSYAYDNKPSGEGTSTSQYGSNDWTDARLMMLLNPGYENGDSFYDLLGSLYWNRKSGTCYAGSSEGTTSCDFTSTGLTTDAQSKIDKVKYYLGGSSSHSGLYADDYYNFERGTTVYSGHQTTWNGYIGIMYPSDYAYATDLSVCTQDGFNYASDTTNCGEKDWLLDASNWTWTMSPLSGFAYFAFSVAPQGYVIYEDVDEAYGVRPVVYLKPDVKITDGTGESNDPYILS